MRGRSLPLSRSRRTMSDLVALASARTKSVIRRRMRLAPLAAAMTASRQRPPWSAVLVKAFALVGAEDARLRRAYVELPWPHLYEYPHSVAAVAIERDLNGEAALFFARIKAPESMSLDAVGAAVRNAKSEPVDAIRDFRRMLAIAGLPLVLRRLIWWVGLNIGRQRANFFGTFGVSTVAGEGATIDVTFNPVSFTLTYGPLAASGEMDVILSFDHRVVDGATVARALARLEEVLLGPVRAEVEDAERPALHIVASRP
jgi:hypothetical protein